jgi:hypothetical protein
MPFPIHPAGFSPDSLRLLDVALTRAWLERVAIGASLSCADAALCADLWEKVERLDKLHAGRRTAKTRRAESRMATHRFTVGQRVIYHSPRRSIGPSIFTVLRRLPTEGQDVTYRIKSPEEGFERVAKERELTSLNEEPA